MAKARAIPDLGKDDAFGAAAAKVVATRAQELAAAADGVLDTSDIERVHDMRVATRRLRAALEVFEPCFPKRRFRAALKEVKALADALGERRDRDVHIAELTGFEADLHAPDRAGVRSFVARLRREQAEANEALAPYVTDEHIGALCERLDELVAEARVRAGEPEPDVKETPAPEPASDAAPAAVEPAPAPAVTNGGEPR